MPATEVALFAAAYLLGAIPFGLILARTFAGVDVRQAGSGNIGATNVARSAGKALGLVTLALDALKGAAPVLVARYVLEAPLWVVAGAGLLAVVGHVFPVFLWFRGGKGVATSLGVFASIAPLPTLIALAVFGLLFAVFRVVSVGSLGAALAMVGAVFALDGRREVVALATSIVLLVLIRHAGNIRRLIQRTEKGI